MRRRTSGSTTLTIAPTPRGTSRSSHEGAIERAGAGATRSVLNTLRNSRAPDSRVERTLQAAGRLNGLRIETDGWAIFEAGSFETGVFRTFERQEETDAVTEQVFFTFDAAGRPSLPVVLTNDYVIDDELSIGVPRAEVTRRPPWRDRVFRPYNHGGIVIHGARGPANAGLGGARIIAWPRSEKFRGEPAGGASDFPDSEVPAARIPALVRESGRPAYGFRSLLGIRGVFGAQVTDVAFDASGVAPRCVTLEGAGVQMHHGGFEGCSFENARAELVHLGAELKSPPVSDTRFIAWADTFRWQASHDLSNLRFLRCRFLTSLAVPDGVVGLPSRCAVFARASQSLGMGFESCYFGGPANPMVHLTNGRYAFDGCHFRAQPIEDATRRGARVADNALGSTNGADIFLDKPPLDALVVAETRSIEPLRLVEPPAAVSPACVTVRNTVSESAQVLMTFNGMMMTGMPTQAATVLQGVQHLPTVPTRPSVYWAGPGGARCVLAMTGCDFGVVHIAEPPVAPVVDMGNRTSNPAGLFTFPTGMSFNLVRAFPR